MGFLDSVSNAIDRGTASVGRASGTAKLKMSLTDLTKQRKELAAQLGASLYEATRENAELRVGREPLYDGIANIDAQKTAIEAEIARLEMEGQAAHAAAIVYKCPKCGSNVQATDLFCAGCGTPIAEVVAAASTPMYGAMPAPGKVCATCGAPMGADDMFCMSCGSRVGA